jgi:hypothetical protein
MSSFFTPEFLTPECVIYLESARRAGMVFESVWQTEWDAFLSAQLLSLTTLRIWATADSADCVPEFQYLDLAGGFCDGQSQVFKIMSQATRDMISVYVTHRNSDSGPENAALDLHQVDPQSA